MENKETQKEAEHAFREQSVFIYPAFPSQEAMKAYYLQMSGFVSIGLPTVPDEKEGLKRLRRKLKQFTTILRYLNSHEWGEGVADLQTACNGFLMLKNEESGKKREVGKTVSRHLEFIVRMSQNIYLLRQLQGMLDVHCQNVELLIKEQRQ